MKSKMTDIKFISKETIYPALWAIIVAMLMFFCGLYWRKISGPEEVVVINRNKTNDTTVTVIQFKPDQEYFNQLNNLTSKSILKKFEKSQNRGKNYNVDSITLSIAKEYQMKFDALRINNARTISSASNNTSFATPLIEFNSNNSKIKRPRFLMPKLVEGYVEEKINSFASISISSLEFSKKEKVTVKIDLLDKSTMDKLSPIFIDIVESIGPNRVNQIWSEQYEINSKLNIIEFSADFKPGKYILTTGFYLLNGLNTKYPIFYSKKFNIEIK
jgi:hypothetical protein